MLKYTHYKKYQFAFWALICTAAASLIHAIIVYGFITGKTFGTFHPATTLLALTANFFLGLSLIFSEAAERKWLKIAGMSILILGLILIATIFLGIGSSDIGFRSVLEKIHLVAAVAGELTVIFFILNFLDEIRTVKLEDTASGNKKFSTSYLIMVVIVAFVFTLFLGGMVTKETYTARYWDNRNLEKMNEFVGRCDRRTYKNDNGDTLSYLLMTPLDYDSQQQYPLVVSLPYGGYHSPPAQWLAESGNRKKYPAFLFVPFCPEGAGWGGIPNYPTIDTLVFEAIEALEKEIAIDTKRIYVSGVSRGGYGSWHFITARPDMFAAAVPVCGGGDPELGANIVDVAVWAFHGEKDRNVPVSGSRKMIEAIKSAGGDPKYTEFSGAGHNIWHDVTITPGLLDWLFAQGRE